MRGRKLQGVYLAAAPIRESPFSVESVPSLDRYPSSLSSRLERLLIFRPMAPTRFPCRSLRGDLAAVAGYNSLRIHLLAFRIASPGSAALCGFVGDPDTIQKRGSGKLAGHFNPNTLS